MNTNPDPSNEERDYPELPQDLIDALRKHSHSQFEDIKNLRSISDRALDELTKSRADLARAKDTVAELAQKIGLIVEMPELLGRECVTDALLGILAELTKADVGTGKEGCNGHHA